MCIRDRSIKGAFYEPELQKVQKPDKDAFFAVEKVIRSCRRKDGTIEHLVKWSGFPNKFDSWTTDLVRRSNNV